MAMDIGGAPSFDAGAYSTARASRDVEAPKSTPDAVESTPRSARAVSEPAPFDGGKPVSHKHVDKFNSDVETMQERMKGAGIDPGPIDGLKGPLTRAAMAKYQARFGKSAADGLKVDPSYAELKRGQGSRNGDTLNRWKGQKSQLPLTDPAAQPKVAPDAQPQPAAAAGPQGNIDAGATKDGHTLPATAGKATTYWNGAYTYKGKRDTDNMSEGAWGDANKPTDYFAALPVGLSGGGKWWHNKKILVTNPETGKQVVVPVQDKGPHPKTGAAIDLSPVAKEALGVGFMDNINVRMSFAADDAPIGPVR